MSGTRRRDSNIVTETAIWEVRADLERQAQELEEEPERLAREMEQKKSSESWSGDQPPDRLTVKPRLESSSTSASRCSP